MKENVIKGVLTVFIAAAAVYFRELLVPLLILVIVMISDYVTGMMSAWARKTLSSRIGLMGLIKKVGYIFGVGVAIVVDFIIQTAGTKLGVDLTGFYAFGMLVTIWLILNECLSILENLSELGVPIPGFLKAVVARLKKTTEEKGDEEAGARIVEETEIHPAHPPDAAGLPDEVNPYAGIASDFPDVDNFPDD